MLLFSLGAHMWKWIVLVFMAIVTVVVIFNSPFPGSLPPIILFVVIGVAMFRKELFGR